MSTDKMNASAVYTLFEELKQEIETLKRLPQNIPNEPTIDLGKINLLFDELKRVSEQRQFTPEQIKVLKNTFAQIAGFAIKKTFEKVDEKHSELNERFKAVEQKISLPEKDSHSVVRKEHIFSIDFKNSKAALTLIALGFPLLLSLVGNIWQLHGNAQLSDNDIKYRYIKMYGKISSENLLKLESVFTYNRDKKKISVIRKQVEKYEQLVKEQAEKMERKRMNDFETNRLKKEMEKMKRK
ncbi:hypothetical protein [Porphyromonas pogonae]|uniref:hypothetical protein n=1 Tax=Porphyromonas pogonae TaxID=867595 RepID=UPI002E75C765|nr:hypothetical protein [Porphyromonas pogonae]